MYGGGSGLVTKLKLLVTQSCLTPVIPWTVPARLLCPWDSPGKNTGVGCCFLLQTYSLVTFKEAFLTIT